MSKTSILVKNANLWKTLIRVLPHQILSDRDDFYIFIIGRLNCTIFVLHSSVSKTSICVKNVNLCLLVFVDSCQKRWFVFLCYYSSWFRKVSEVVCSAAVRSDFNNLQHIRTITLPTRTTNSESFGDCFLNFNIDCFFI